jgi:nicotinamide-nucleotide amidase
MQAEILTIGTEILSGSTVDTNSAYAARRMGALGIVCARRTSVPDEREALVEVFREAIGRCDLLLATGGLGPTSDDITIQALTEAIDRPLIYNPEAARLIRRFYTRRNRPLQQAALRQAYVPQGGIVLPNPLGTAPGLWLELGRTIVIALPGVPSEMQAILDQEALPRLRRLKGLAAPRTLTLRTAGLVELHLEQVLRRIGLPDSVQVGLYPHLKMVDLQLTATGDMGPSANGLLARLEKRLRRELGSAVYATGEDPMEAVIGRLLLERKRTLAIAESCTGGLISDRLTDIPDSSRYLLGSITAYHNELKSRLLGVSAKLMARRGAVSAQVARCMAEGVRAITGSSIGLSITGIAGPSGGTRSKPVGLVYLGIADARRAQTWHCRLFGSRQTIKVQAAQTALNTLRLYLLDR